MFHGTSFEIGDSDINHVACIVDRAYLDERSVGAGSDDGSRQGHDFVATADGVGGFGAPSSH